MSKQKRKLYRVQYFFRLKNIVLALILLENLIFSDLLVFYLWLQSFTFCILGSISWILKTSIGSQILFFASILFFLPLIPILHQKKPLGLQNLKRMKPNFVAYILFIYFSVAIMVLSNSIPNGILSNVVTSLVWYNLWEWQQQIMRKTGVKF